MVCQRTARLTITGELDLAALPELTATMSLIEAEDVDASEVTFVAACCLRALDNSRKRLEGAGRSFQVVASSPTLLKVGDWARYRELVTLRPPDHLSPPPAAPAAMLGTNVHAGCPCSSHTH